MTGAECLSELLDGHSGSVHDLTVEACSAGAFSDGPFAAVRTAAEEGKHSN
jgi:hypothetical protein